MRQALIGGVLLILAFVLSSCGDSAVVYSPAQDGDVIDRADSEESAEGEALPDGDGEPALDDDAEPAEPESDSPDADADADAEPDDDALCSPNNCRIEGVCYAAGATPVGNACRYCHPGASSAAWTERAYGEACGGGKCDGKGACVLADGDPDTDLEPEAEKEPEAEPELDYDFDSSEIEAGNDCQNGMTLCGDDTLYTCMNNIWAKAADCFDGEAKAACYNAHCITPKSGASCTKAGRLCFRQLVFSCEAANTAHPETLTWKNAQDCLHTGLECWRGACIDPKTTTGYTGCRVEDRACTTTQVYYENPVLLSCQRGSLANSDWGAIEGPCTACVSGFCQH